jgi:hypothetical protein
MGHTAGFLVVWFALIGAAAAGAVRPVPEPLVRAMTTSETTTPMAC